MIPEWERPAKTLPLWFCSNLILSLLIKFPRHHKARNKSANTGAAAGCNVQPLECQQHALPCLVRLLSSPCLGLLIPSLTLLLRAVWSVAFFFFFLKKGSQINKVPHKAQAGPEILILQTPQCQDHHEGKERLSEVSEAGSLLGLLRRLRKDRIPCEYHPQLQQAMGVIPECDSWTVRAQLG